MGAQQQAAAGAHGAPGLGAEVQAVAARLQAAVVGLVQQVAELQTGLGAGGGQFDAAGPGAVVEDELVVAARAALAAGEFLALVTRQDGGVLVGLEGARPPHG